MSSQGCRNLARQSLWPIGADCRARERQRQPARSRYGARGTAHRAARAIMSQAQGRAAGQASCRRVLLFGVLPFVAGIWLVLITFRHQGLPGRLRPAVAQTLSLRQNCSQALAGGACDCGDGTAAGNVSAAAALASRLGGGMLESVLGGRNGSAAAGGQAAGGDALENIFLFVGILSGRGYRHRRLAGRHRRACCTLVPGCVRVRCAAWCPADAVSSRPSSCLRSSKRRWLAIGLACQRAVQLLSRLLLPVLQGSLCMSTQSVHGTTHRRVRRCSARGMGDRLPAEGRGCLPLHPVRGRDHAAGMAPVHTSQSSPLATAEAGLASAQ